MVDGWRACNDDDADVVALLPPSPSGLVAELVTRATARRGSPHMPQKDTGSLALVLSPSLALALSPSLVRLRRLAGVFSKVHRRHTRLESGSGLVPVLEPGLGAGPGPGLRAWQGTRPELGGL